MPSGTITSLDINFSNASGAEHKATIKAVEASFAYDFDLAALPSTAVVGELEESLSLGDPDLNLLLKNFTTTQITTEAGPKGKKLSFELQDNLSLKLKSIAVLLRGRDVGPNGELDFSGVIYNWTELPDNIKYSTDYTEYPEADSFVLTGTNDGLRQIPAWLATERILILGQIYNIVELEDVKQEIWTKAYLNKERQFFLELPPKNDVWFINYTWPSFDDPEEDRGSWQDSKIKLGFTLKEFTEGLDNIGISWDGIPLEEEFIIDESGTLYDIISSAANKLGYYWYINPETETVHWIDSIYIETLPVVDYTDTTEEKIVSSSYSENVFKEARIFSYNTTKQEERREQPQRTQKDRKLLKSFKLLNFNEKLEGVLEYLCEIYYLMWNKDLLSEDYFNKLWFFGMHYSPVFVSAIEHLEYEHKLKETMEEDPLDFKKSYFDWKNRADDLSAVERNKLKKPYKIVEEFLKISEKEGRTKSLFKYGYDLEKKDAGIEKSVPMPSEDVYYALVKNYMDAGMGGIYMSGPISNYSKERIAWETEDGYEVIGMWRWDAQISDIPELAPLAEFAKKFNTKKTWDQVKDFAKNLYPNHEDAFSKDRYYAFAVKTPIKKFTDVQEQDILNTFEDDRGARIVERSSNDSRWLLLRSVEDVKSYVDKSRDLYPAAVEELALDEYITIRYRRQRHPIKDEEHRDQSDNDVPTNVNYEDLDLNREDRFITVDLPSGTLSEYTPVSVETIEAESSQILEAIKRNKATTLPTINKATSSRTIFDLEIPVFSPETASVSISFGSGGVTTTIQESTLKILPIDQSIIITRDNIAKRNSNTLNSASAGKKNFLGL
jgi:hypothetical protein